MEDNKNQELSLDELLAKLKASLVEEESASAGSFFMLRLLAQ